MAKVLPFTRNSSKDYSNVPDGLKWAIPIYECLDRPEVKQASAQLAATVKQELEHEAKAKRKASFRRLSKTDSKPV